MLAFISCAKTMAAQNRLSVPFLTEPVCQNEATQHALELSRYSAEELMKLLKVNDKIAAENWLRFQNFCSADAETLPALCAYTGQVFKRIAVKDFTEADWRFAQDHLRISSFIYGLLRPLDGIRPYRLEGDVRLAMHDGKTMFESWRDRLTDAFIADIQQQGGILLNIASAEMMGLFHWKKVEESVRVITPEFLVRKGSQLKVVTVYAKMCRGEMTRFFLKNRFDDSEALKAFEWEGFRFSSADSTENEWRFVNG